VSSRSRVLYVASLVFACLAGVGFAHATGAINCPGGYCAGTAKNNEMYGTTTYDMIESLAGNDKVWGRATGDDLHGGADGDYIEGNAGNDVIRGQLGNDRAVCDGVECGLNGGQGDDVIYGFDGNDTLFGGDGNDILNGDNHNDNLRAYDGLQDLVFGGAGTNVCSVDARDIYVGCGG